MSRLRKTCHWGGRLHHTVYLGKRLNNRAGGGLGHASPGPLYYPSDSVFQNRARAGKTKGWR